MTCGQKIYHGATEDTEKHIKNSVRFASVSPWSDILGMSQLSNFYVGYIRGEMNPIIEVNKLTKQYKNSDINAIFVSLGCLEESGLHLLVL